jgi:hypothetical protein
MCPECREGISQYEIKTILGEQFMEEIDKLAESILLS